MSDLGGGGAGRAANGGARAQGPIPVQTSSPQVSRAAVIPPTEIMRRREERAKAQQERAQASGEEEGRRLQEQWAEYEAASVAAQPPSQQQPVTQPSQASIHRRTQSVGVPASEPSARRPTDAPSYPEQPSQPGQAPAYSSSGGPVQPPSSQPPPTAPTGPPQPTQARSRASTQAPRQPRPVPSSAPAGPSGTQPSQSARAQRAAAAANLSSQNPPETPETRAERTRLARELGLGGNTPADFSGRQDGTVSSFPHAFERWEILSSKWEGMTSHWISRLQMNSEELQNQPMLAQLSRQVTDLSAAGANLFTALVELQRLRASSERKFQRWFNDTKHDMERQQERYAQLQNAIIRERTERADDQAHWEKQLENARRIETNSIRYNSEKDRELQIAKDESRRAWEELGRFEAVERERQKALAQNLPVNIGGFTVYPRLYQESRQGSVSQDVGSQEAPRPASQRGRQTSTSVEDDPFLAARAAATDEVRTTIAASGGRFDPGPGRTAGISQPSSNLPASLYGSPGYASTAGYTTFSSPSSNDPGRGGLYSQANTHLGYDPAEEEDEGYEMDDQGRIMTDSQGRPVPYRRGLHEARSSESEGAGTPSGSFLGSETDNRRRVPATSAQAIAAAAASSMQTRPETDFGFFRDEEEDSYEYPDVLDEESQHYHPTRLSDVPEEDASEVGGPRGGVSGAPF